MHFALVSQLFYISHDISIRVLIRHIHKTRYIYCLILLHLSSMKKCSSTLFGIEISRYLYFCHYFCKQNNSQKRMNMKTRISFTIIASFIYGMMFAGTFVADKGVSYSTDDLKKLVFSNGKVDTYFTDGSMASYDFSSLQRIYYTEVEEQEPTAVEEVANDGILLYPNPAVEYICINGVPTDANISVFNMNGLLISNMKADGNVLSINVANYKSGIYFVRINSEVVKFIKK